MQQKDTLKRLIELVHSPYSSLKNIAAMNIKSYIKDFPELEDDAINAVYDLCEDQDQRVCPRIRPYCAMTLTVVCRYARMGIVPSHMSRRNRGNG